jgi:hypothetical protein
VVRTWVRVLRAVNLHLVLHDLLAWRDARLERAQVCCWRTTMQVLTASGRIE